MQHTIYITIFYQHNGCRCLPALFSLKRQSGWKELPKHKRITQALPDGSTAETAELKRRGSLWSEALSWKCVWFQGENEKKPRLDAEVEGQRVRRIERHGKSWAKVSMLSTIIKNSQTLTCDGCQRLLRVVNIKLRRPCIRIEKGPTVQVITPSELPISPVSLWYGAQP